MSPITFNFGPIARTAAGGRDDTINLASLPLHVLLNALTAATSAEEFIAWLWHDLYKPAFQWAKKNDNDFSWLHIPGIGAFQTAEKIFGLFRTSRITNHALPHQEDLEEFFAFYE